MKLYNLTNEDIPNNLITCRRGIDFSNLNTSFNKDIRICDFLHFFELIEKGKIPLFLIEYININILKVEYELEKFRIKNFNTFPSRISSTFASEISIFNTYQHTLEISEKCKIIKCDMTIINFLRSYPGYLVDYKILNGYWQGQTLQEILGNNFSPPIWEYLIEGEHSFIPKN